MADTKKTGSFKGKSNQLGHGGRAAQLAAQGVPKGSYWSDRPKERRAPGMKNYHGSKRGG